MTDALRNLGGKVVRRVLTLHKPIVRLSRRRARAAEQQQFRAAAYAVDRELRQAAAGTRPIVVGPWLAEVGYEALYWVPFLRWWADTYAIPRERLVVVSRGGVAHWYASFAAHYVELFDLVPYDRFAERNRARQTSDERGGQKQSALRAFDSELIDDVRAQLGLGDVNVCHPSLMFRLFKHVWYGNLPVDFLWTRTRYTRDDEAAVDVTAGMALPSVFTAVKFYSGTALPMTEANAALVRDVVCALARTMPVVTLDADFGVDEHRDFAVSDIPNVISVRQAMTPATNLGLQSRIIARASRFVGTCGGLAWLAPFLGTPATAVFADDQLLGTHLMIARQAVRSAGAAEFATLDLRGVRGVGWHMGVHD